MHQDRLLGLGLLLLCALGWFWLIPVYVEGDIQQVYPRAVIILISLASLGLCLRSEPRVKAKPIPPEDRPARLMAALKLVGLMAAYLAYLLLIPRLGFFSCSLVAAVFFLCPIILISPFLFSCSHAADCGAPVQIHVLKRVASCAYSVSCFSSLRK